MASWESGHPVAHTWAIDGVNGDKVQVLSIGEVIVLHTGDGRIFTPEVLMARLAEGNPVELTHEQAEHLLEVLVKILRHEPDIP